MASTRKPKRAERAEWDLLPRLRAQLADTVPSGSRILIGLSGGVDSIVLLDLLHRLAARRRLILTALHVNHQLQHGAAAWASFCRRVCREAQVPLRVTKVDVARGNSVEGAARLARYQALLEQPADYIALAHNQDDQAETVLLHLLRGAGIRGLAGMRVVSDPPLAARGTVRLLRPLLDVPRSAIERYAEHRKLEWIEDPSNASIDFNRNFLRAEILPRIAQRFPSYRVALARAARHAAEAACMLDDIAHIDMSGGVSAASLDVAALRALAPSRAKNALSAFLRRHGIEIPSTQRIEEALRQVLAARADAGLCIDFGAKQLRRHGAAVVVVDARKAPQPLDRAWHGEAELELSELGGTLRMKRARGGGISAARLRAALVTIRARSGGERLRPNATGPTRTIKNLMQEARMPAWERDRVPFIYCGDELVCVPGLAIASAYQAGPEESCIIPVWRSA
jgi:tRNA(Ile)-lysidine synthase